MGCTKFRIGVATTVCGVIGIIAGLVIGLVLPQVVQTTVNDGIVCPQSEYDDCYSRWYTNNEDVRPITGSEHDPTRQYNDVYMFNITNKDEAMVGKPIVLSQVGPYRYRLVYKYYNALWDYTLDTLTYKEFRQMIPDDASDPVGPMITQLSPTALRATFTGLSQFLNSQLLPQLNQNPASSCFGLTDTDVKTPAGLREWDTVYQKKIFCNKEMMLRYNTLLSSPIVKATLKTYGGDFFVALSSFLPKIIKGLFSKLSGALMAKAQGTILDNIPTLLVGAFVTITNSADATLLSTYLFQYDVLPLYNQELPSFIGTNMTGTAIDRYTNITASSTCGSDPTKWLGLPGCSAVVTAAYVKTGASNIVKYCQLSASAPNTYDMCPNLGSVPLTNQQCCLNLIRTNPGLLNKLRDTALTAVATGIDALIPGQNKTQLIVTAAATFLNTAPGAVNSLIPIDFSPLSSTAKKFFASDLIDLSDTAPSSANSTLVNSVMADYSVPSYYPGDPTGQAYFSTSLVALFMGAIRASINSELKKQIALELPNTPITWPTLLVATPAQVSVPRLMAYQLATGGLTDVTTYPVSKAQTGTSINSPLYNLGFLSLPDAQALLAVGRNINRGAADLYLPFPPNFVKFEFGLRFPTAFNFADNNAGLAKVYSVYKLLLNEKAHLVLPKLGQFLSMDATSQANETIAQPFIATYLAVTGYNVTAADAAPFFSMVHKYLYSDLTPILRDWLYSGPGREFGLYVSRPVSDWARGLKSDIYEGATGLIGYCQPGFLTHHTGINPTDSQAKLSANQQGGCISPSEGGNDADPNNKPNSNQYSYYTGKQDISKIWSYAGIGISDRTAKTSTNVEFWRLVNYWYYPKVAANATGGVDLLRIEGHSGTQFMPAKKTYILHKLTEPRVNEYEVFVTQANRHLRLVYDGNTKVKGITINVFRADKNILNSDNLLNPYFFEPILVNGVAKIVNGLQTTIDSRGFPSWISRPYFTYGDIDTLLEPFPALKAKLLADGNEEYDTWLGIEPITGATMQARKKLQGNIGVMQGMFSDYAMYNGNVSAALYNRPIPFYWVNEWADIPDPKASAFKHKVYVTSDLAYAALIAGPLVGGLMTIVGIFLIVSSRNQRLGGTESQAAFVKNGGSFEVANPIYAH